MSIIYKMQVLNALKNVLGFCDIGTKILYSSSFLPLAKKNRMHFLLSVDLGVKTGLAMFRSDGRLLWFRSQNFGNASRLKRAIPWILNQEEELSHLIIEGGGPLLKIWKTETEKRNIDLISIMADEWRSSLLFDRERRKGTQAKMFALNFAEKAIHHLCDHRATSLNNDAAEAILIGIYGMQKLGWIADAQQYFR